VYQRELYKMLIGEQRRPGGETSEDVCAHPLNIFATRVLQLLNMVEEVAKGLTDDERKLVEGCSPLPASPPSMLFILSLPRVPTIEEEAAAAEALSTEAPAPVPPPASAAAAEGGGEEGGKGGPEEVEEEEEEGDEEEGEGGGEEEGGEEGGEEGEEEEATAGEDDGSRSPESLSVIGRSHHPVLCHRFPSCAGVANRPPTLSAGDTVGFLRVGTSVASKENCMTGKITLVRGIVEAN
jgi:hypothetical protein